MPKGISEIPELRLEVLEKLVTTFMSSPALTLTGLFPSSISESNTITWESMRGGRGMTPFVSPGSPSPQTAPHGVTSHRAEAANWREKMYMDEYFLNNIRKAGTQAGYEVASVRLARELQGLVNRSNRRKEWMFAKMVCDGAFSYRDAKGTMVSVDYDIPAAHQVALTSAYRWPAGATKDILGDIQTAKKAISDDCGGRVDFGLCSSTVMKYIANDVTIRGILQKNTFGDGNLYKGNLDPILGVNPAVVGSILDIPNLVVYDEMYEVKSLLIGAITGGSTVAIPVAEAADFEAGGTLRFHNARTGAVEDTLISSINYDTMVVTIAVAPVASYRAGEDYVSMRKTFIPENKFIMVSTRVDGQSVAEYKRAPFGLERSYGVQTDRWEEKDPEGVFIRVRDRGLPVLFNPDAVYQLTVAA